ncbi:MULTISPECIES: hypothetical protein [Methanosarcina]|uniref:hypothetical protein n=1 Tax=Methanosarcina TaxID=2207 RepID=UPI000B16450A|nr:MULTISPECIES: hypothetical protein [Methanosarcina]
MDKRSCFFNSMKWVDLPASLFKKLFNRKPFQKRLDRKLWQRLNSRNLFPNPIGVINRRNGCAQEG